MAGLMDAAQAEPRGMAGAPKQGSPESAPEGGFAMRQASPEEQELYDTFVSQAMMLMYDEGMRDRLLATLEGGGDPAEGLARVASFVTGRVATAAEEAGQRLTPEVVFNAGAEIVNQLADVATEAGVADFQNDPDLLEKAYFRTLDHFRQLMESAGRLDPQAAAQDVAALQAMDERGEYEALLRGLAENDPRMEQADSESVSEPRRHQQSAHPEFIRMGSGLGEHPPQTRGEPTPGHWQHEFWHPPGDENPQMGTPEWRSDQAKNLIPGRRTFNRFFSK